MRKPSKYSWVTPRCCNQALHSPNAFHLPWHLSSVIFVYWLLLFLLIFFIFHCIPPISQLVECFFSFSSHLEITLLLPLSLISYPSSFVKCLFGDSRGSTVARVNILKACSVPSLHEPTSNKQHYRTTPSSLLHLLLLLEPRIENRSFKVPPLMSSWCIVSWANAVIFLFCSWQLPVTLS